MADDAKPNRPPEGPDLFVEVNRHVAAPPDRVWEVIGRQFADIAAWSRTVRESRPLTLDEVGHLRVAPGAPVPGRETISPAATLREVLVDWNDTERTYAFDTLGLPRLLRGATNRTRVEPDDDGGAIVSFSVHIVVHPALSPLRPLLRRRMTHTFGGVLADLKDHVEAAVRS